MGIIKAEDFEKLNQNKLTIAELRQQEKQVQQYIAGQADIRQKMAEAEESVSRSLSEEITLLDNRLQLSQKSCKLAEQEVARLKTVITDNAEVLELKTQLAETQAYLEKMEAQCADLEKKLTEENQAKLELAEAQTELKTQAAELQSLVKSQAQTLAAQAQAQTDAETELGELTQHLAAAKQEVAEQAVTLENENIAYTKVLEDMVDLKTEAGITATKMTALQTALLSYETDITELRAALQKETLRNEQLLTEKAQAQYLFEKQKRASMEFQLQLKRSRDTELGVGKTIQNLNAKTAELESAKEKAVGEMNRVIGALRLEQEKNIQHDSDFQRAALEFKTLKAELAQAKDTIALLNVQLENANSSANEVIEIPIQA